jgi:hypothetical protein
MRMERASRADGALNSARLIAPKHAGAYRAGRRRASILWSIERQSDGRDVFVLEVQKPALTLRKSARKDDGSRKIGISLSPEQYEKLSIAAVKKGVSRNQLLTAALKRYVQLTIER